jgi:hypothetical protein
MFAAEGRLLIHLLLVTLTEQALSRTDFSELEFR